MDQTHLAHLMAMRPEGCARRGLKLFLEFHSSRRITDVPDPYYGGPEGFAQVLEMIEHTGAGLLQHVRTRLDTASHGVSG